MKGISLHIGINQVDDGKYPESYAYLNGAEEDAQSMHLLATDNGFEAKDLILGAAANIDSVTTAIKDIAHELPEGGLFLLTYSGHGGRLKNPVNDPKDPYFQTWCLYDGHLVDKKLYSLWGNFKKNTRILVVSDSCYSGSVIKLMKRYVDLINAAEQLQKSWLHKAKSLHADSTAEKLAEVKAAVILLASSQDSQKSKDSDPSTGSPNSKFTTALLNVWDNGAFTANHKQFLEAIQAKFSDDNYQKPNYFITGTYNETFIKQTPFTI